MKTAIVSFLAITDLAADQLANALSELKVLSRDEEGVVHYEIFRSQQNPRIFFVRESWSDQHTLEKHMGQPHLAKFVEESKAWLVAPFTAELVDTL